jgi:hypothetical protein
VALFGLGCGEDALTPEKSDLLDVTVRGVRQAWTESGVFAPGAGGWWIAAQVPGLAYAGESAATRFAMLKQAMFPATAVARLYDPFRAEQWALQIPVLNPDEKVLLPESCRAEEILAYGLADALRRGYPETTPGEWLAWLKGQDRVRLAGLLMVALWMMPVALGGRAHASRRLWAAWLAACGALGLVLSLTVLYRLQMRFGTLYLLAGVGSCLYLTGLFCGNRLAAGVLQFAQERPRLLRGASLVFTLFQAVAALAVLAGCEHATTASGVVIFCWLAGCAAGVAVPVALSACEGSRADGAAVFVLADALGAAVAGLMFVLLVPLAGLWETVACFGTLACGIALCVTLGWGHARLTAGLALVAAMAALGGHLRDAWPERLPAAADEGPERVSETPATPPVYSATNKALPLQGIPRKVEAKRLGEQMRAGRLSTNSAAFWEGL